MVFICFVRGWGGLLSDRLPVIEWALKVGQIQNSYAHQ